MFGFGGFGFRVERSGVWGVLGLGVRILGFAG